MTDLEKLIRDRQDELRGRPLDWIDWFIEIDWKKWIVVMVAVMTVLVLLWPA